MAGPSRGGTLGKRVCRSTAAEQQQVTEPPRASKRLRAKKEASAGHIGQPASGLSTISCNGLTTPEASFSAESQTAQSIDTTPRDPNIFPFMQLPAELRIHIYYMALHRDTPLYLHVPRAPVVEKTPEDLSTTLDPDAHTVTTSPANLSTRARRPRAPSPPPDITPPLDPIVPTILRLNQQTYKEARSVLYSTNTFTISLHSGVHTLSTLHQRSRSLIKHAILTIPSHHDILDGFADLVRLGLRYCWGLKTFKIVLQANLPDEGRTTHATSVYANAFRILRWLPRGCEVVLDGNVNDVVKEVVREEGRLQGALDEMGYAKRQHQMPERH